MKHLLLIAVLLLSVRGQAQNRSSQQAQLFRDNVLKAATGGGSSNKATGEYWRIVSTGNHQDNGTNLEPLDSTKYTYSNARGSATSINGDLMMDDYGLESEIMFDTALKFANSGSGLERAGRYIGAYNSNNERTTFTEQTPGGGGFVNEYETRAVRDANGNIAREISFSWNGNTNQWDTSRVTDHVFDAMGNVIKDSTYHVFHGNAIPSALSIHTYDSNKDRVRTVSMVWSGTGFDSSTQEFSTYNNNRVVTVTGQAYIDNQWVHTYFDTSGYNSNGAYNFNEYREWDTTNKHWVIVQRETRSIGINGLPQDAFITFWDNDNQVWDTFAHAEVNYDNNDNPTQLLVYVYIGGMKLPDPYFVSNIHYESYYNVGIHDAPKTAQITVYPNPASDAINIVLSGQKAAHITLTNMAGQTARVLSVAGNAQKIAMNVAGLPPGNYLLDVTNADTAPCRQIITIR